MNKTGKYLTKIVFLLFIIVNLIGCSAVEIKENKFALEAYNDGRYLTAITYSTETLAEDPFNYGALMIKGKSNLKLNNYTEAIKNFSRAIDSDEKFEPYYYRSRAYLEINELENSASDLEKAISYNPQNVDALFDFAYVQTLLGDYESALDTYNKVINIEPLNSSAYVNIGNLKGRMGDSESAIQYFSKAINIKPNDVLAYFNRATEKLIINDKKGAVEDLSFCVSIDSTNINTYFLLAETMIEIKDYKNAISKINKIVFIDPQNARAFFLKGKSELAIDQKDNACMDLRKAGELGYYDAYELITKNCVKKEKVKKKTKR